MARPADLEKNLALPLQQNLPIIQAARQIHQPKSPHQRLAIDIALHIRGGHWKWQWLCLRSHQLFIISRHWSGF